MSVLTTLYVAVGKDEVDPHVSIGHNPMQVFAKGDTYPTDDLDTVRKASATLDKVLAFAEGLKA